jgi:hypothetical protein
LCLCTLRLISIQPEGTFGRLRYSLGTCVRLGSGSLYRITGITYGWTIAEKVSNDRPDTYNWTPIERDRISVILPDADDSASNRLEGQTVSSSQWDAWRSVVEGSRKTSLLIVRTGRIFTACYVGE